MRQAACAQRRIHGGNPWELLRASGLAKERILDCSVDVNPLGFPPAVRSIILDHLDDIGSYPDPNASELREAIAAHHQIPSETILPGNGVAELIGLLTQRGRVKHGVVIVPTFGEYEWMLERCGAALVTRPTVEAEGFQLDLTCVDSAVLDKTDVVFLCNPNNPTGTLTPQADVLALARRCREHGVWLVVDESFIEFLEHPAAVSVVEEAARVEHLLVLRSLTKFFAVPGLRLGYAVAAPSILEDLRALQSPWPLNTFALAVGARLFQETTYAASSRRMIAALRDELYGALNTVPGLRPFPSMTNFLLCKLTTPQCPSSALSERMARQGIVIRNCDSFTGLAPGRFVRLAVKTRAENHRLVAALRGALPHVG